MAGDRVGVCRPRRPSPRPRGPGFVIGRRRAGDGTAHFPAPRAREAEALGTRTRTLVASWVIVTVLVLDAFGELCRKGRF